MAQTLTLKDLILTRLLGAGSVNSAPATAIYKALEPFLVQDLGATKKRTILASTIAQLINDAAIERVGNNKLKLSVAGQKQILEYLESKQGAQYVSWQELSRVDLIVHALELPKPNSSERRRLRSADGLRAAVLQYEYKLPLKPYSTLTQVRDSLLWYCLQHAPQRPELIKGCGMQLGKSFTIKRAASQLLSGLLGSEQVLQPTTALRQLAAKAAGAKRTDISELRSGVIRASLRAEMSNDTGNGNPDLAEFVNRITAIAKSWPNQTGKYGDNKIFISHLWREYIKMHPDVELTGFKEQLLHAHRQHMLQLARADLQQAMDPSDVLESEIEYWGASFHFLRVD